MSCVGRLCKDYLHIFVQLSATNPNSTTYNGSQYRRACLLPSPIIFSCTYLNELQGMPLLLCLVVALVERFGSCSLTRPNMGTAQCFLGQPWGDQWAEHNLTRGHWTAFFSTPEFIYFHR